MTADQRWNLNSIFFFPCSPCIQFPEMLLWRLHFSMGLPRPLSFLGLDSFFDFLF